MRGLESHWALQLLNEEAERGLFDYISERLELPERRTSFLE